MFFSYELFVRTFAFTVSVKHTKQQYYFYIFVLKCIVFVINLKCYVGMIKRSFTLKYNAVISIVTSYSNLKASSKLWKRMSFAGRSLQPRCRWQITELRTQIQKAETYFYNIYSSFFSGLPS